jgi:hypothetical protein
MASIISHGARVQPIVRVTPGRTVIVHDGAIEVTLEQPMITVELEQYEIEATLEENVVTVDDCGCS